MTDNVITLKNNALKFRYFSNKPENEWIPFGDDGIFYKPTLVAYSYLVQENKLIKLDNKEETIVKETNLYKALTILYPDIYN